MRMRQKVAAVSIALFLALTLLGLIWLVRTTLALASAFPDQPIDIPLSPLPSGLNSLMPVPTDNPLTVGKIELGRKLFFDKRLSRDGTVSCASCHQPDKAFSDGRALPIGIGGQKGRRNAPSLINAAYGESMFWDGRAATLEEQALHPLTSPIEMGNTLEAVLRRVHNETNYRRLALAAFGTAQMAPKQIAQALSSFQRTLVAGNSPYDRYFVLKDESVIRVAARRGLVLFRGKARCAHCHEGPLFTDQKFHNTGVSWGREPLDLGRFEVTRSQEDKGKFKTPTLRHLTDTAPYMHDGTLKSLEEVIDFYNRGAQANPNLDSSIKPLSLSPEEKSDLATFLRTLSARATNANERLDTTAPAPTRPGSSASSCANSALAHNLVFPAF